MQRVCRSSQTDGEQANRPCQLDPHRPLLGLVCGRGAKLLNPILLRLVLIRPFPDERSQAALIVGRERHEAKWLQSVADWREHLCAPKSRAGAGQEHQLDLRPLVDGLRERKQSTGGRNYLKIGPNAFSIGEAKHSWSAALKMCAWDAPSLAGLGEAVHNLTSVCGECGY